MKRGVLRKTGTAILLALCMAFGAVGCSVTTMGREIQITNPPPTVKNSMQQLGIRERFYDGYMENGVFHFNGYGQDAFDKQLGHIEEDLVFLQQIQQQPLSEEERRECEILQTYLQAERTLYEHRLCWEPMGSFLGEHTHLPLILEQNEVDNALLAEQEIQMVQGSGRYLDSMLAFQQEKAAAGLLMGQDQMDQVVAFCRNFAKAPEEIYLIDTFAQKVDGISELSEEEKQALKQEYREAVIQQLAPGYLRLADGLEALKPQCIEGGACKTEEGKAYYQALMTFKTGSSRSAEEMIAMLDEALDENDKEWNRLMDQDGALPTKTAVTKLGTRDPYAIAETLKTSIQQDFPTVETGGYQIFNVNEQVEDNGTGGVYYQYNNQIYLTKPDEKTDGELFLTLAHEGFPGHLYQFNYHNQHHPYAKLRQKLSFEGYTEGWATYAEQYSAKYAQDSERKRVFMANESSGFDLLAARIDLGVNYEGWGKEQIKSLLRKYDYVVDEETVSFYWNQAVSAPGDSLSYAIGYLEIMELQGYAKAELGEAYTDMEFHRAVLEAGPSPFWHVRSYVEAYVERTKAEAPQGQTGRAA